MVQEDELNIVMALEYADHGSLEVTCLCVRGWPGAATGIWGGQVPKSLRGSSLRSVCAVHPAGALHSTPTPGTAPLPTGAATDLTASNRPLACNKCWVFCIFGHSLCGHAVEVPFTGTHEWRGASDHRGGSTHWNLMGVTHRQNEKCTEDFVTQTSLQT